MGNKIARTTQVSATEYYLHDLPSTYNLVLVEILGRGRFFKSILCKHDEGLVLVKVYFKRGDPLDLKVPSLPSFLSLTLSMTIDMPALYRSMRGGWLRSGTSSNPCNIPMFGHFK